MLFLRLLLLLAQWADSFRSHDGEDHRRLPDKSYPEFRARVSRGEFLHALRTARAHDFFAEDVPPDPTRLREVLGLLSAETAKLPALSEYSKRLQQIPSTADHRSVLDEVDAIWDEMLRHLDHLAREQEDEKKRQAPARRDAHVKKAEEHLAAARFEEACYELERATALDPLVKPRLQEVRRRADIENLRRWGERHAAGGKTAEARDCFERLLRLSPDDEAAKKRIAEL